MLDISLLQRLFDLEKMKLITSMKSHGNRILGNTGWCRLSSSVNSLGNLRPMGEVGPDNHIVDNIGLSVAIAGLLSVNGWSA